MADYHSSLTGPEIDAALTRAKAGGEIDTLLAGKAPAGYGLGESQGRFVANASVDTLTKNGWYYLYDGVTGGPSGLSIYHAILFVSSSRSDLTKVQRLILATGGRQGQELRRVYKDGSWLPWEWIDPPMELGLEYRTTERYLGKPVYVQAINFGALPNAAKKAINHGIPGISAVIDIYGNVYDQSLTVGAFDGSVYRISGDNRQIIVYTNTDISNYTAVVVIKYTK